MNLSRVPLCLNSTATIAEWNSLSSSTTSVGSSASLIDVKPRMSLNNSVTSVVWGPSPKSISLTRRATAGEK